MSLTSALSTALTGLTAAEETISVTGNNVANSNTVGFKSSTVQFATQFSQTLSLGSAPTTGLGGTNPRQVGLGVTVAEITPNFSQGTLQVSNSPSDLAIQGDGFFVVQGSAGDQLYTRNGVFKTNSANELVTTTGRRLLGFGVNTSFQVQNTSLVPITIPFGAAAVAQATSTVTLGGTLNPSGNPATLPEVIQSEVLTDGSIEVPGNTTTTTALDPPSTAGTTTAPSAAAGAVPAGIHNYKIAFLTASGLEGPPSAALPSILTTGTPGTDQTVDLGGLPLPPAGFVSTNIYRDDGAGYTKVGNTAIATFSDTAAAGAGALNTNVLTANQYSYYVTFYDAATATESRPTALIGPQAVNTNGRIELNNIPQPAVGSQFNQIKIYRNTFADGKFHLLTPTPLAAGSTDYIDGASEASIIGNVPTLNLDGPSISNTTKLIDVVTLSGTTYSHVFNPNYNPALPSNGFLPSSTLNYTGQKGADLTNLTTKQLTITSATTVQDYMQFIQQASGIQPSSADPLNPIPGSPGGAISNSRVQFTSNIGTENAVTIPVSAFTMTYQTPTGPQTTSPSLGFNETQKADGESAKVDMLVYNSLGQQLNVRVTAVMETKTGTAITWRWFADSGDNSPATGSQIAVGTGEFTFDAKGNYQSGTNKNILLDLAQGTNTLPIGMDFTHVSGLAAKSSTLFVTKTDGSAPGTLSSFVISENGLVSGLFTNGVSRNLGQIQLARFANNDGLEQRGQNLFAAGVNSGVPIVASPGEQGLGSLQAGAVEQSNTDVGQNLIDLITASTQYRGGARVITTVQQLLDELMNLHR